MISTLIEYSDDYNRDLLAEVYDQTAMNSDDIALLLSLTEGKEALNILEVFSGTGRILIPLLNEGHAVTGIEIASAMVARAELKAAKLGDAASKRLTLKTQDALLEPWGAGEYDVVIIGCNALYELPTPKMQETCIMRAFEALKPSGRLFIDNNNWQTPLEAEVGRKWVALQGTTQDGTFCRQSAETVSVELAQGLMHIKRTWYTRTAEGVESTEEYMGSKRPVNGVEVEVWLKNAGFKILHSFGDTQRTPSVPTSPRAIFWAIKP